MRLRTKTLHRLTRLALLTAAALIISWLERPLTAALPFPIPGFKLGLANIVILFVLYRFGFSAALTVQFLRIGLSALLFGTPISACLSVCGGACAILSAGALFRLPQISIFGTSLAAAAMHMVGQIAAAALILSSAALFTAYLPYLLLLSLVSGGICGILAQLLVKRLPEIG